MPDPAPTASSRHALRWVGAVLACAASLPLVAALAPGAPLSPESRPAHALVAFAIGFAAVSAMALVAGRLAPAHLPARALIAALPIGVALALLTQAPPGPAPATSVLVLLLLGGSLVGALIGERVQHVGHLGIVALVSSVADVASVLGPSGPSAAIAESAPLLSVLALSFPMLGTARIEPLLGVGDIVFVALYFSAARAHRLSIARTWLALALGLALTAAVVVVAARAVPALPFVGALFVIVHPETRLPPPEDRRRALVALLVLGLVLAALLVRAA